MVYSVLRTPGGIEVLAEEDGWAVDDGYRLALVGAQDATLGRCLTGYGNDSCIFDPFRGWCGWVSCRSGHADGHCRGAIGEDRQLVVDGRWCSAEIERVLSEPADV